MPGRKVCPAAPRGGGQEYPLQSIPACQTLLLHALLVLLAALLPVAIALLLIRAEADQLAHVRAVTRPRRW